jgi:putative PEP-CTERM system TPR-repeat lipoprotein
MAFVLAACDKTEADRLKDARRYMEQGELRAATIELKNVLQADPESVEARFQLGKALVLSGDLIGAEVELRRAVEAGYSPDDSVPMLATTLVALNRNEMVVKEFANRELGRPEAAAELKNQLALAYLNLGRIPDAVAALDDAMRTAPTFQLALETRARLEAARGDVATAKGMVETLLKRRPDDAAAWVLRGDVLYLGNDADKATARGAYEKALTIRPDLVAAHAGLLTMQLSAGDIEAARRQLEALKAVQPSHPQTQFFEALLALHDGRLPQAQSLVQRLVRISPDNPRLLALAGQIEVQSGAYLQAESYLQRSIALVPSALPPRRLLAELYLLTGRPAKVLDVLQPVLAAKSVDLGAAILAGRAQLMLGDVAAAERVFLKVASVRPDDPQARTGLAMARIRKGDTATGLAELRAVAASDKGTAADLALISALSGRRDFPAALKAIESYGAKVPGQPHPEYLRGQIAAAKGDRHAARASWESALQKQPSYLLALYALGNLDLAEGKRADSVARIRAALQKDDGNVSLKVALADYVARTGGSEEKVTDLLQEAIRARPADPEIRVYLMDYALQISDRRLAEKAASESESAIPLHPLILDRVGLIQQANGHLQRALSTFQRAAALQPDSAAAQLRLVSAYLAVKDYDSARLRVRRAMELDPQSVTAPRMAVLVALRSGHPDEAAAVVKSVKSLRGADALVWQLEGEVELAQQHFDAAAAAFRHSLEIKPSGEVVRLLHMTLIAGNKRSDADRVAQAWLQAHPGDLAFLTHMGETALAEGNVEQAEKRFLQVVERAPDNAQALNNLAYVLALQKKPGSTRHAEKAVQLAPNRPALMDTLAACYAAEGRLQEAVDLQTKVVSMEPENPDYRLTLARLQIQAGDQSGARDNLSRLSKLGPEFGRQGEVEALLKKAGS